MTRHWVESDNQSMLTVIMLNPSIADATHDDPTLRRCTGLAKAAGAEALRVVNLFALRSTDPDSLASADDPIGPLNDKYILAAVEESDRIVAAWSAHPVASRRAEAVYELLRKGDVFLECWETTKDGHPRHPLYVRNLTRLQPWVPSGQMFKRNH
ncbi:DUF1643 domain-containing protein [Arthrobacter sp. ISL-30]|uniref:DUF1643 domain-containing protein n=1 Tax=Arthrobacter sp. ISL-30 TaxID=2819109 RepID=UPI001BE54B08|nr:DUF1643 domain-containing protein [Arthrobacter sp. ISL-30]MBT2514505.1 DUF1643 domain-containing protein [Arthrobacter sp. ISL-30]